MAYIKQNFTDGTVLEADHLNNIENQIIANEAAIEEKADRLHEHTDYAAVGHSHDEYAAVEHEHSVYATIDHKHDDYANATHGHTEYALSTHNHDSAYDAHGSSAAALDSAKTYTDEKVAGLLDNSEGAIDSLLELAEVMKDNPDVIDNLQSIAENKADKVHTHTIDDVSELTTALDNKADLQHTHDGYATASHEHSASNITSGILKAVRGGTGNDLSKYPDGVILVKQTASGGAPFVDYVSTISLDGSTITGTLPLNKGGTEATTELDAANNLQVPSLAHGTNLTAGMDLNNITDIGNYRCTTSENSKSLLNNPCPDYIFTMKVGRLPNNSGYIWQEITRFTDGKSYYRTKSGADKDWSKWGIKPIQSSPYPTLTSAQKTAMHELMKEWFKDENRYKFYYEGDIIMDEYADNNPGCYNTDKEKFKLNCSTFVQFIMMGRKVSEIVKNKDGSTYESTIDPYFDFGYCFQYKDREYLYGLTTTDEKGELDYYGFKNPLNDETTWKGTYSKNTYYTYQDPIKRPKSQTFNTFAYANDMAKELYELGCEIPVSQLDIGDIVFSAGISYEDTESMFDNVAWRKITHVFMVYGKSENDELIFIECTDGTPAIVMSRRDSDEDSDRMQAASLLRNIVMCARMPIAFGIPSNVGNSITKLKTPK